MKAKLIKTGNEYLLRHENGKVLAISNGGKEGKKLSLKNCQAIDRGYDLDELAENKWDELSKQLGLSIQDKAMWCGGFKYGLLEILGDKKFSEEDVRNAWDAALNQYLMFHEIPATAWREQHIQSLQQTEWDVVAITKNSRTGKIIKSESDLTWDEDGLCDSAVPVFDADGCLILKHEV